MNLHAIAAPFVGAVNPMVLCSVQVALPPTKTADYGRTPQYAPPVDVDGQIQSLTWRDLQQLDGLNLQGTRRAIYLYGDIEGIVRATNKGGDLITTPNGDVWLVAQVLESWGHDGSVDTPGWTKVAATLQNGS